MNVDNLLVLFNHFFFVSITEWTDREMRRSWGWISNATKRPMWRNSWLASSEWNRRSYLYLWRPSQEVCAFSSVSSEFNSAGHASTLQLFDIRYFPFSLADSCRIKSACEFAGFALLSDERIRLRIFDVDRDFFGTRSPRFSHSPFKLHYNYSYVRNMRQLIFLLRKENMYSCFYVSINNIDTLPQYSWKTNNQLVV